MTKSIFWGLRTRLFFLILLAVIPCLFLIFYTNLKERRMASAFAAAKALDLAYQSANKLDDQIEATRQLLIGLSQLTQAGQAKSSLDSFFFSNLLKQYSFYTNLGVTGKDGRIVASAIPLSQPVTYADREWFQSILKTHRFTISRYLIGRITGKPSIVLSYPLISAAGQLEAIIFATLDLRWLTDSMSTSDLPSGSTCTVIDDRGTILARHPNLERWIGRNLVEGPIVKAVLAKKKEDTTRAVGIDGVERLYGFTHLSQRTDVGAYLYVGIPSSIALAEVNRILYRNLIFLGVAIFLILVVTRWFGARFILIPVDQLLMTTKRMGEGDLTVRTGPPYIGGEIGQLALAFDRMCESLQMRETERIKTEARLKIVIDTIPLGAHLYELQPDGRLVFVGANQAADRILGIDHNFLIGKSIEEAFPGLIGTEVPEAYRQVAMDGEKYEKERVEYDEQGIKGAFEVYAFRTAPERMMALFQDITDRKRTEEALRITQFSVDRASDSIAWIGPKADYLYVNDEFCRFHGYSRQELLSMTVFDIDPEMRVEAWEERWEEIKEQGSLTMESRHRSKEGRVLPVEVSINHVAYNNKEFHISFIRDISERLKAQEQLKRRLDRIGALRSIDLAISASLDLRVTLNILLDQVTTQLGVDATNILLMDRHTHKLEYGARRGFRTSALEHTHLSLGEGYAGQAALERRTIIIPHLKEAVELLNRSPLFDQEGFIAYLGVPLVAKGQILGVLEVFHRSALTPDREWLDFLEALAGQAALAIDNATLFSDLQKSNVELIHAYDTTLEGWSRALDLRDKETEGHSQRVTEMTLRIAGAFEFEKSELLHVRRGALLHDIGKMGIPDKVLFKPGPLDEEEWKIMRKHPVYAYELLYPIAFLRPAVDIPYCHHEKWDGSGYPRGLRGEQIPLAARIFAVVDVWDALRSDRPYRPAWPEEKTREHIQSLAGSHFDPKVVDLFLKTEAPDGEGG